MSKYVKQRRANESLQRCERQFGQINNYIKQGILSETYEQQEEQNIHQERGTLHRTNETPEKQDEWWRHQQEKGTERRIDECPKQHEGNCIQEQELCALQRTCETMEQKRSQCIQEQGELCRRQETKVPLHKRNVTSEQHEERCRHQQEKDAQRIQQEMFTLQGTNMIREQKKDWHMQKQGESCKQVALHKTSETLEQLEGRCR
jgi:hypothetical protein